MKSTARQSKTASERRDIDWWVYHDQILDALLKQSGPPDVIIKKLESEMEGVDKWIRQQKRNLETLPYDQHEAMTKLVELGLWSESNGNDVVDIITQYKYDPIPPATGRARAKDYFWTGPFQDDDYRYQFSDPTINCQEVLVTNNFNPNQPRTLPCSLREVVKSSQGVLPALVDPATKQRDSQLNSETVVPEPREVVERPVKSAPAAKRQKTVRRQRPVRHIQEHKLSNDSDEMRDEVTRFMNVDFTKVLDECA